jgi:maltose O-acetyltransferase
MFNLIRNYRRDRYLRKLQKRGLALGKNVELNDGFFLDPSHCFLISIEDGVTFGPGVRIFAHDASSLRSLGKTRIGLVRLRRNCFIGASSVVLPGCSVGENSIVGANSTVTRDVPANEVWAGTPAVRILSLEGYVSMLASRPAVDFHENTHSINVISEKGRQEMIRLLERDGIGFMVP